MEPGNDAKFLWRDFLIRWATPCLESSISFGDFRLPNVSLRETSFGRHGSAVCLTLCLACFSGGEEEEEEEEEEEGEGEEEEEEEDEEGEEGEGRRRYALRNRTGVQRFSPRKEETTAARVRSPRKIYHGGRCGVWNFRRRMHDGRV